MKQRVMTPLFVLLAGVSAGAHADGTEDEYSHSEPAIARTLSPNEYLVNADGMREDPDHKMTDVARAYRNGMIAGRKEAEEKRRAVTIPPLPTNMTVVDATPQPVAPSARPYDSAQQAASEQRYAQYPVARAVQPPPVQYVAQQNVYRTAPVYAEDQDDAVEAYAPPPPPVYVRPPRYVYVQPAPRIMRAPPMVMESAPPMDYWGRTYVPAETMARPYAYAPY